MIKILKKKIVKIYYKYIRKDMTAYSRKIGVKVGTGGRILADPDSCFGSEPWLITIGNHVEITVGAKFFTHEGGMWCIRGLDNKYENLDCFAPIEVGDNVFIGNNSVIMPGVHIGNNCIVGAHAVVTRDVPNNMIVAGVPAKPVSSMDKFLDSLPRRTLEPTKHMTQEQKRWYLQEKYPEWF